MKGANNFNSVDNINLKYKESIHNSSDVFNPNSKHANNSESLEIINLKYKASKFISNQSADISSLKAKEDE